MYILSTKKDDKCFPVDKRGGIGSFLVLLTILVNETVCRVINRYRNRLRHKS